MARVPSRSANVTLPLVCCLLLVSATGIADDLAQLPKVPVPLRFPWLIEFFITDLGINQYRDPGLLRTGDDFSKAKSCVFPILPKDGQVLIVMPAHQDLAEMSDEQVKTEIFEALKKKVEHGIASGSRTLELQIVEHIGTQTYASPTHQEAANRFGKCAYEAIGMLHDYLEAKGYGKHSFRGIFGSNGTKVFSENVSSWKSYMEGADFFDGRAFETPMIETIAALGPENVRIFNTAGDWPAPSGPFARSIGNHEIVKGLKDIFPSLTVGWFDPLDRLDFSLLGKGHLAAMQWDTKLRLLVKFWNGKSYTAPVKTSSSEQLPRFGSENAKASAANGTKESGVSMQMSVRADSFSKEKGDSLRRMRAEILKSRPREDSLTWSNSKLEGGK